MTQRTSQADRGFLVQLQRSGPQSVTELCEAHGVTPTAIRHRLGRLLLAKLVERRVIPSERGRPHHEYLVTSAGRRSIGDDYASFARLLWQEILRVDDPGARTHLLSGLRDALAARYRISAESSSVRQRFQELSEVLNREGFDVEADEQACGDAMLPVLREHHCPYHDLATRDRQICELEQSVFEEVLGVPVTLAKCCHDGHPCCEFTPKTLAE